MLAIQETNARDELVANIAGQTVFAGNFRVDKGEDLDAVRVSAADASETMLTLNSDYTLSGLGSDTGFTLTISPSGSLPTGLDLNDTLVLERNTAIERETAFKQSGDFTSAAINDALNFSVYIDQELKRGKSRSMRLSTGTVFTGSLALPKPEALKFFRWNEDATFLTMSDMPDHLDGDGDPAAVLGQVGDTYLNRQSGDYFKKTGDVTWELRGNFTGAEGQPGSVGALPDGTVASPGLAFGLDNDTGIFRAQSNTWAIAAGGLEAARYENDGGEIKVTFGGDLDMGANSIVNAAISSRAWPGSTTLVKADAGGRVIITAPGVVTVPTFFTSLIPVNAVITIRQETEGVVEIRGAGGVTLQSRAGFVMGGPGTEVRLEALGLEQWRLDGELAVRPLNPDNLFNISNFT